MATIKMTKVQLLEDLQRYMHRSNRLTKEVDRHRRALYAGTRRYLRQQADLRSAVLLADSRALEIRRLEEQVRKTTEHRDELQEFLNSLRGEIRAAVLKGDRYRRALDAGTRRYGREALRARILQKRAEDAGAAREQTVEQLGRDVEFLQEKLREERHHERRARRALYAGARRYAREQQHAEQLDLAGQEQALLHLQAVADSREAHKIMHAARMRADKLAAKLVLRAGELGRERQAWARHIAARERALDNAIKRARGLQGSLRKTKAELATKRRELEQAGGQIRDLRQKLRTANSSVIMEALGGGLEIRPISGLLDEDTTGYTQAALRATRRANGQR